MVAILAGSAVAALLGWTLWTLSTSAPLESIGNRTVMRAPSTADERVLAELPVAPDPPPGRRAGPRPRPMEAAAPPAVGPSGVLGLVLDGATGQPVPVFQVHVLKAGDGDPLARRESGLSHPFHVLTGVFFLEQEAGSWDVIVEAAGYEPSVRTGVPTPALVRTPLLFELSQGAGLIGLVLDQTLMPVAGVRTFLHVTELFGEGAKLPLVRTATTGADGRFSYSPLPDGDYAVSLLEPDNTVDRAGGLRISGDTLRFQMFLRPRHELTVHVQGDSGAPLAGALVEARSTAAHFARGKTNENGLVLLEHLPDGVYTLKASLKGLATVSEELELYGGASQQVRWLTLSP